MTGETTPGTHCRETFAWGLRNPFRMAFNVANTGFFINDVGQDWIEEIDASSAGADYGWSCMEGNAVNLGCAGSFTAPIYTYTHANGCTSITGGAFVPAGVWPSNYDNGYLFADYVCGKIFFRNTSGAVTQFASGLGGLTTLKFGPNGSQSLYYTNYDNGGQIRKITFSGPANQPPTAKIGPNKRYGALPLTVTFRSTGSSDPNGDPLTFRWDFGDGSPEATGATVQHTYTSAEDFIAVLTASDGRGGQTTASAKIFAGDTPPQPTIAAPLPADLFSAGQQITLTGSASDVEQGTIADERLTWEVLLHHDTHTHPFMPPTSGNNLSLTAPEPEDLLAATNSYLEIKLTATDARGLKTTVVQNLMPKKVDLTFTTNNPGTPLMLEGTLYRSPATVTTWAGNPVDVDIADSISPSGQPAQWSSWSDGGDRAHTIVAPATNETYTATFVVESAPAYIATADAHVRLAQSSTNFGRERRFSVTRGSAAENGFLRFSLTGVPAGFQSATLYLFVTDSSNNGPTVYRTSSAWKETTVTWANQPNRSGAALGSFGRVLSNTWVALDVTAAVAGDGTVNFVLLGDSSDRATFAARTTAGKEPRLVLRGATGDGTPPSTPANLSGDAMASNTVNLSWDASTDASGIANYDVLREGVLLGATTSTSFVDKTAPANSSLDYIVIARDGSGLTSAPSATATVDTPMPTSTFTFAPGDDTFVFASSPSTNYGTRSYLQTRGTSVITFIRFTTQGLQGPVYRATLRVYVTDGTDDGPAVFKTTNSGWAETTLTYANKPGPTSSVPADDTGAIASGGWIELDVTALIAGNGPIAFLLQQTSGDAASFGSSESATPPQPAARRSWRRISRHPRAQARVRQQPQHRSKRQPNPPLAQRRCHFRSRTGSRAAISRRGRPTPVWLPVKRCHARAPGRPRREATPRV